MSADDETEKRTAGVLSIGLRPATRCAEMFEPEAAEGELEGSSDLETRDGDGAKHHVQNI